LKKQQHVMTWLRASLGKIILSVVLGSACFGVANNVLSAQPVHAASVSPADSSVVGIIQQVFGPDAPSAMNIARCESTFNSNAVNSIAIGGSHAEGLFQILYPSTWYTTSQAHSSPFDARANAIAAHEIFIRDGHSWREWECRP
jgi:Transglycosylase SLT domain